MTTLTAQEPAPNRVRIEEAISLPLGAVLIDQANQRWIFVGSQRTTTGYKHYFVREGMPDWSYNCAFLDTFERRFPDYREQLDKRGRAV